MPLSAGAKLGPFEVERQLGRGGMGEVYLARDTRLDRFVAIKALPDHLTTDPDRLARFEREAKVLASLSHPGIAGIYGLEITGSQKFLILEFVEGETLAGYLARGRISIDAALPLARQIAEALEAAHEKGVIHRDLKPGNVMVSPEGVAKVLDFGLARRVDAPDSPSPDSPTVVSPAHDHSPTIPGAIMGTAGYMSPEQARGKAIDKRSDIFSFGCVLYAMLSGASPFPGETVADSLGAILHRDPDWSLLPSTTPPRVRELLANCLAKDRKHRLHDMADARLSLERSIAGHEWTTTPTRSPSKSARVIALLSVAGGALLTAGGARVWNSLRPPSEAKVEPTCVTIAMPAGITFTDVFITRDGRTLVANGTPKTPDNSKPALPRLYTR